MLCQSVNWAEGFPQVCALKTFQFCACCGTVLCTKVGTSLVCWWLDWSVITDINLTSWGSSLAWVIPERGHLSKQLEVWFRWLLNYCQDTVHQLETLIVRTSWNSTVPSITASSKPLSPLVFPSEKEHIIYSDSLCLFAWMCFSLVFLLPRVIEKMLLHGCLALFFTFKNVKK